ncbi:MAG: ribonuclease G [Rhodobacteraceae bacterium]|nr:MAG: ribonuclease G [Paracoccaceae bacterium]
MKGRQIVLDHLGDAKAAALMVDGQLDDLLVEGAAPAPGTIYRAVADRPVKGQGGIFLKTPEGMAFLRQAKGIAPGDVLTVQVAGYAEPGKAIPVTTRLLFKSRYAIVTPDAPGLNLSRRIRDEDTRDALDLLARGAMGDSPFGLILRSACAGADEDEIAHDIAQMRDLATQVMADRAQLPEMLVEGDDPWALAWRDWSQPADIEQGKGAFARTGVAEAIAAARGPRVALGVEATMFVEPTRALIAVDVNTGGDGSHAAGLKANIAAARALPRALRVRGLGGQVLIDLAPMPKKDRRVFEDSLRAAFRADEIETVLAGWTPLGNYELQRKRARLPLAEALEGVPR